MSGVAAGQIVGIPLGKFLAGLYSFRLPFILYGITMAGAVLLIWYFVPQPNVRLHRAPLTLRNVIGRYFKLIQVREVAAAAASYFLMFASIGLYLVFLPTWLEHDKGLANNDIVLLFFVGGLTNVVVGPMAGQFSDRVGRKPLIIFSCIGLSIVMVSTTYVVTAPWVAYALFGAAMIMISLRISPFQALLTALVKADRRGILMSLTVSIGQIGTGWAGGFAGATYTKYGYLSNTLMGAVAIALMAFMVYQFIPEPSSMEN